MPLKNLKFRVLLSRFEKEFGREVCWIYPGKPKPDGYCSSVTVLYEDGRRGSVLAHKLAYLILIGPYPDTTEVEGRVYMTQLDHLCLVRRCFNPWHLEPVPQIENWRRSRAPSLQQAHQTHCKNGHPLLGDNLFTGNAGINKKSGRPRRRCRICAAAQGRMWRALHQP
jgi:hypothetical protein